MFYKSWFEKGVRTINDLFNNNGSLLSFRVFSENYNVRAMFVEYEGLLAFVRNYLLLDVCQIMEVFCYCNCIIKFPFYRKVLPSHSSCDHLGQTLFKLSILECTETN